MLAEGKRVRWQTGKSLMVPRYEIVRIPEKLRNRMSQGSIMEFPAETAQSMIDFRADDQVGNIAPRVLLLLHSANDSVTPTYESIEMFKKAGQPTELRLLSDVDHFTFNEQNQRLTNIVKEWLGKISGADTLREIRRHRHNLLVSGALNGKYVWLVTNVLAPPPLK